MEVAFSNFELDPNVFGKTELVGIVDRNSNFIYNRVYNIENIKYNKNIKVSFFLNFDLFKNKNILNFLKESFEITSEIERKRLGQLSTGELIKVLIIKLCLGDARVIILDHIDSYLNNKDLQSILKSLKNNLKEMNKTVLFSTNKIDNIVGLCTKYIIASEDRVIYEGTSIDNIPEKTEIMKFVDLANAKKGVELKYHRESSDLLKAIYRSVKK